MKKYLFTLFFFINFGHSSGLLKDTNNYAFSVLPKEYAFLKNVVSNHKAQKPIYTILYLYSNSVPSVDFANILYGVYVFNKTHNYKLQTIQATIGINNNQNIYLNNLRQIIFKSQSDEVRNSLMGMVDITISPEVFERLGAKKVPIIALAKCMPKAHPSKCQILYFAHGNIGVGMFMNKLKDKKILPIELQ